MVKQVAGFWDCPPAIAKILCKQQDFASTTGIAYDLPQLTNEPLDNENSDAKIVNSPDKTLFFHRFNSTPRKLCNTPTSALSHLAIQFPKKFGILLP